MDLGGKHITEYMQTLLVARDIGGLNAPHGRFIAERLKHHASFAASNFTTTVIDSLQSSQFDMVY
jgi:hypothetical protein